MIASVVRSFWFRALLSLSVLAYLLGQLDGNETWRAVLSANPWYLAAAIAVDAITRATMVSRWVVLIHAQGKEISFWSAGKMFLVSSFLGTALPTGGADVTRAYALSQRTDDGKAALASVAVDRLLGISALMVLAIIGLAVIPPDAATSIHRFVALIAALVTLGITTVFFGDYVSQQLLPQQFQESPLGQWIFGAAKSIAAYRSQRTVLAIVFSQSLVVQALRVFEVSLLGAALALDVEFSYYLAVIPIGLLAFMLPISVAGIGVPQGVIVWLLQPAGVANATSFTLSTLIVVLGVLCTLPGVVLYLRDRRSVG